MAYTSPKTWTYKESLSAADLNTFIRDNFIALDDRFCPVGSIREFAVATNPNTLLGFGTWAIHGAGMTTVCFNAADAGIFDTLGGTYGEKTHLLTGAESGEAGHNHIQDPHGHRLTSDNGVWIGNIGATSTSGQNGLQKDSGHTIPAVIQNTTATNQAVAAANAANAHNNIQPSIIIYRWVRTA